MSGIGQYEFTSSTILFTEQSMCGSVLLMYTMAGEYEHELQKSDIIAMAKAIGLTSKDLDKEIEG